MTTARMLALGLTLVGVIACTPVALSWCLGMVVRDRLRTANRVAMRQGRTPRVTLTYFAPTKSWWGRA